MMNRITKMDHTVATSWGVDGTIHRLDGPAIVWGDGRQTWYVNGIKIVNDYELSLFDTEEGRLILLIKYGEPT